MTPEEEQRRLLSQIERIDRVTDLVLGIGALSILALTVVFLILS